MITIKYVGHERWRTAAAAKEYGEEAEVSFGRGNSVLLSDEQVAELVAKGQAYLAARAASHIRRTTPEVITELAYGEIFVFGSNLAGRHGAGAARLAAQKFGAVYGVGEGLTGRSYAFPTLTAQLRRRTPAALARSAATFLGTARQHPELTFLLTKVGCGLAGYDEQDMAALFKNAPPNVVRPPGW